MTDQSNKTIKTTIRLTVPAPDPVKNPSVETRATQLNKWVQDLPYANPVKVEEEIFESLFHLNRYPEMVPNRSELMACYRNAYETLFDLVRKEHVRKDARVIHHGKMELTSLLLKVTIEMAYGYKLVINEGLELNQQGKRPQHLGLAIYFAMKALTQELVLEYAAFVPDSRKTWREIYQLYSLAEEFEVQRDMMEEGTTIDLLFKRILLIVLMDPYHLHRGEVWFCMQYLSRWGLLCKLEKTTTLPSNTAACFLVDLHGMNPPKPLPADTKPNEHHRILHTTHLCQSVHKHLQLVQENSKVVPEATEKMTAIQSIQMFRHMLLAWHVQPERRSPRVEKYGLHKISCGLSAANYFVGKDKISVDEDANPFMVEEEEQTNFTLEGPVSLPLTARPSYYHIFEWRIFNISASGVGLIVATPFPKEIQVGQLVVLEVERKETPANCSVGVIRRMIQRDPDTMEVGVQFLHGELTTMAIRHQVFGSEVPSDYQAGLRVEGSGKQANSILAPYGMFRPRQEYIVDMGKQVQRIYAEKLLESTPAFDRFTYHEMPATMFSGPE